MQAIMDIFKFYQTLSPFQKNMMWPCEFSGLFTIKCCDLASYFLNTKVRKQFYIIIIFLKITYRLANELEEFTGQLEIYGKSTAVWHLLPTLIVES